MARNKPVDQHLSKLLPVNFAEQIELRWTRPGRRTQHLAAEAEAA